VDGAYGIIYRSLDYRAAFFCDFDRIFHIADIVEGVEYSENFDAGFKSRLDELFYDVVSVVFVADEVLAA